MSHVTLYPTHKCFDDAMDFLEAIAKEHDRATLERHFLCHGICVAPDGDKYSHAWVEADGNTFNGYILNGERVWGEEPMKDFYVGRLVLDVTRYTVVEAWRENQRSGTYGPWVERYRELCGTDGRTWTKESTG